LSTTCRYRRRHTSRGTPRNGEPCSREVRRFLRFVLEVTQGGKDADSAAAAGTYALDLTQAVTDAAPTELLFGRLTTRPTADDGFFGEANEAHSPGRNRGLTPAKRPKGAETCLSPLSSSAPSGEATTGLSQVSSSAVMRTAAQLSTEATHSMQLTQRKNKLIDTCRAVRSAATEAAPPETVSLAELMKAAYYSGGREMMYDSVRFDDPSSEDAKTWTLPGDRSQPEGWTPQGWSPEERAAHGEHVPSAAFRTPLSFAQPTTECESDATEGSPSEQ
jgi:hypothetical protein